MILRCLLLAVALIPPPVQDLGSLGQALKPVHQFVAFLSEPQVVAAGASAFLDLHFRVLGGLHVNSHTPGSQWLIPTGLALRPADGIRVRAFEYPAGKPYHFNFDPATTLDVYSEDFTVRLPVMAAAGQHELRGELKYQACDKALCYPPQSLPVSIPFTAR